MIRCPRIVALAALAVLLVAPGARADRVRGIRPALNRTIAVEKGIVMLPLDADRHGDRWPQTIDVRLGATQLEHIVALVHARPVRPQRRWTDRPAGLAVRAIEPGDDTSSRAGGQPYLLARLPDVSGGMLSVNNVNVELQWFARPAWIVEPRAPAGDEVMALEPGLDRPDPESPFEYWRWALLADRLGVTPPGRDAYDMLGGAVAEYHADAWAVALRRLADHRPAVAAECRDALTRTCADADRVIAAWVTDPMDVAILLNLLLDADRPIELIAEEAQAWADARKDLILWPEADLGDRVRIAVMNPSFRERIVHFVWLDVHDVPLAMQVPPNAVARFELERPRVEGADPLTGRTEPPPKRFVLQTESEGRTQQIAFGPEALPASPPGLSFAPLQPPLTLHEANGQARIGVDPTRTTHVQLRQLTDRWEVFFDCRRIAAETPPAQLASMETWTQSRGTEAITLFIGDGSDDVEPVILTVPEVGWQRQFSGVVDPSLEIHRRRHDDRWICRLVLPTRWIDQRDRSRVKFAFARTHGDGEGIELRPGLWVPWDVQLSYVPIDLAQWSQWP